MSGQEDVIQEKSNNRKDRLEETFMLKMSESGRGSIA